MGFQFKARHRLDGVVYAVKITKKKPKRNSRDEKVLSSCIDNYYYFDAIHTSSLGVPRNLFDHYGQVALNEVFVLAAMMKHRHVVRYALHITQYL